MKTVLLWLAHSNAYEVLKPHTEVAVIGLYVPPSQIEAV